MYDTVVILGIWDHDIGNYSGLYIVPKTLYANSELRSSTNDSCTPPAESSIAPTRTLRQEKALKNKGRYGKLYWHGLHAFFHEGVCHAVHCTANGRAKVMDQ